MQTWIHRKTELKEVKKIIKFKQKGPSRETNKQPNLASVK